MSVVGENYKKRLIYIPEMLMAARAMKVGMEVLEPLMRGQQFKSLATIVIGTVKGDLHDIGKNLVGVMMEGAGMKVIDLGIDVSSEKFLEAVKTHSPHVLAISALLTTTLSNMKETIDDIRSAEINETPYILVGGAIVTQQFADMIGADAYGKNAVEAVNKTKTLLQIR
jgi:methanogenic corrinoid protein MtbC1